MASSPRRFPRQSHPLPMLDVVTWRGGLPGAVRLLDQTLLPARLKTLTVREVKTLWRAIRDLQVRGAPAIGCAAAFGVVLGVQHSRARTGKALAREAEKHARYLATSRPTAVNLFWALDRMTLCAREHASMDPAALKRRLLDEAQAILEDDRAMGRAIGAFGEPLVPDDAVVITHCNAGALATGGAGTALAVLYAAHAHGKRLSVFTDETRPLLQGSRLSAWELMRAGIETTVICDNMAAHTMKTQGVNFAIVGADRIAANGDAANKIGTYALALCAKAHGVPFYVAAPSSTFDLTLSSGEDIPIEERSGREITEGFGVRTAPRGVKTFAPAFDVTPAKLITALITERGVIAPVTRARVARMLAPKGS